MKVLCIVERKRLPPTNDDDDNVWLTTMIATLLLHCSISVLSTTWLEILRGDDVPMGPSMRAHAWHASFHSKEGIESNEWINRMNRINLESSTTKYEYSSTTRTTVRSTSTSYEYNNFWTKSPVFGSDVLCSFFSQRCVEWRSSLFGVDWTRLDSTPRTTLIIFYLRNSSPSTIHTRTLFENDDKNNNDKNNKVQHHWTDGQVT